MVPALLSGLAAPASGARASAATHVPCVALSMEAGVDSLGAVELRNQLQRAVGEGVALSSTVMFDHPTARQVAAHVQGSTADGCDETCIAEAAPRHGSTAVDIAGVGIAL